MNVRIVIERDYEELIHLIIRFRESLAKIRSKHRLINYDDGKKELIEYLSKEYPIFIAENDNSKLLGFMVCRIEDKTVWVETIYVDKEYRRKGVASELYLEAEQIAIKHEGKAPYNWVDPNNETMIEFLRNRGYSVLNLIELRKEEPDEKLINEVNVGTNIFKRQ